MKNSNKTEYIRGELSAIESGESRTWGQIAHLLYQVEISGYWRKDAGSFSEWLVSLSTHMGVNQSTLWRYLNAARYYNKLWVKSFIRGDRFVPLYDLSEKVSPENLELLEKLSRVVPLDVFNSLEYKVINGAATRAELRTAWKVFREVLAGRTARGRGVSAPRIDPHDNQHKSRLNEAMALNVLQKNTAEWTGVRNAQLYKLFFKGTFSNVSNQGQFFGMDAVAVTKADNASNMVFHGIKFIDSETESLSKSILEYSSLYFDDIWLATFESSDLEIIPDYVGVMIIGDSGIEILRTAKQAESAGINSGEVAKLILDIVLHR